MNLTYALTLLHFASADVRLDGNLCLLKQILFEVKFSFRPILALFTDLDGSAHQLPDVEVELPIFTEHKPLLLNPVNQLAMGLVGLDA